MAQSDVMCSLLTREAHITRRSRHHARSAHHVPLAEHIVPKTKKQSIGLLSFLVAGMGFEPHDLRVMSPTSYQAALPRDIIFFVLSLNTLVSYHIISRLSTPFLFFYIFLFSFVRHSSLFYSVFAL